MRARIKNVVIFLAGIKIFIIFFARITNVVIFLARIKGVQRGEMGGRNSHLL